MIVLLLSFIKDVNMEAYFDARTFLQRTRQWHSLAEVATECKLALADAQMAELEKRMCTDRELRVRNGEGGTKSFRYAGPIQLASEDSQGVLAALADCYPAPLKMDDVKQCYANAERDTLRLHEKGLVVIVSRTNTSVDRIEGGHSKEQLEHLFSLFRSAPRATFEVDVVLSHMRTKWKDFTVQRCKPLLHALTTARLINRPKNQKNGKRENKWHTSRPESDIVFAASSERVGRADPEIAELWSKMVMPPQSVSEMRKMLVSANLPVMPQESIPKQSSSSSNQQKPQKRKLPRPRAKKDVHKSDLDAISQLLSSLTGKAVDLHKEL
jgi:hypothetical protein